MPYPTHRKLKVSFAMGGGVSLGAYSGAALTEALKLLLVRGRDDEGRSYTHIELDSMSGASAGAISLCIMLSCLLNYQRYLKQPGESSNIKFNLDDIDGDLQDQFGSNWKIEHAEKVESLRALQLAQQLQKRIWVDQVTMTDLMRIDQLDPKAKDGFSLLNRDLLVELVNDYILKDIEQIASGCPYIINQDRFLFACSLTNLSPLQLGNLDVDPKEVEPLVRELRKAYASYTHKELRVFDFQLNPQRRPPSKLPKAIVIERQPDGDGYPVNAASTWSMITATCLACGAFPFAFQPVPLRRFPYEYYEEPRRHREQRPQTQDLDITVDFDFEQLSDMEEIPVFQSEFKAKYNEKVKQIASTFHVEQQPKPPQDIQKEEENEFIFSYIDGGTLNNEPIREAFRLANYIDSRDPTPRDQYDRIVVFVDPIVPTEPMPIASTDYDPYRLKEQGRRIAIRDNTEFNRLSSYTNKIIRTLRDQGSIKEEHKITTYVSSINLHEKLAQLIQQSSFDGDFSIDFMQTIDEFINFQDRNNNDEAISTFDVNDHAFIKNAIRSFIINNRIPADQKTMIGYFYNILIEIDHIRHARKTYEATCQKLNQLIDQVYKPWIKKLFYQFILQAMLDTDGKDPSAMRMAITPVRYALEDGDDIKELKTIQLPGEEFQAFGGFVSESARAFSNTYGRYCAYKALSMGDFRRHYQKVMQKEEAPPKVPELIQADQEEESKYRKKLLTLSPLNNRSGAQSYWNAIRKNIYHLMKRRIIKSIRTIFFTKTMTLGIISLLFVFTFPWLVYDRVPFNGFWLQLILFIVYLVIGYKLIQYQIIQKLKKSFYRHELPGMIVKLFSDTDIPKLSCYRFNGKGAYHRLRKDNGHLLLSIPFYLKRDPDFAQFDPQGIEVFLLTQIRIPKAFKTALSISEEEIIQSEQIHSIHFYRRYWVFWKRKVQFEIKADDILSVEGIKLIEQHISPVIVFRPDKKGVRKFTIVENARPLEDVILQKYQATTLT